MTKRNDLIASAGFPRRSSIAAASFCAGTEPEDVAVSNDETAVVEQVPPVIEPTVEFEFASSRELGGRIVQVKSENATLEWSGGGSQEQDR